MKLFGDPKKDCGNCGRSEEYKKYYCHVCKRNYSDHWVREEGDNKIYGSLTDMIQS